MLETNKERLREQGRHRLTEYSNRQARFRERLRLLGPEQVLSRGYSITMNADTGEVLREAGRAKRGQRLRTRLKSGEIKSRVET